MKQFFKNYRLVILVAGFTAAAIIIFEMVNLLVLYGYVKLDIYLCIVAGIFLLTGVFISRKFHKPAPTPQAPPAELLTAREKQVLQLIAEGRSNKEIAAIHFIEVSTVKTHVNNIYTKLAIKNRKEAAAKHLQMDVVGLK
jgi:DNA-binding CsgD family transcriptional regulator